MSGGSALGHLEPMTYGNLVSQHRSGTTTLYLFDALGPTRTITDHAGTSTAVIDSYDYKAYGETYAMQGIIGPQCWRAATTLSDTQTSPAIVPDQVVGGSVRATQSSNNPSPPTANRRTRSTILRRDVVHEDVIVLAFCNARVAPNASSVQL